MTGLLVAKLQLVAKLWLVVDLLAAPIGDVAVS